ncbi:hypothetical protein VUR80DRAFT_6199 [Thermomyces stellatus]
MGIGIGTSQTQQHLSPPQKHQNKTKQKKPLSPRQPQTKDLNRLLLLPLRRLAPPRSRLLPPLYLLPPRHGDAAPLHETLAPRVQQLPHQHDNGGHDHRNGKRPAWISQRSAFPPRSRGQGNQDLGGRSSQEGRALFQLVKRLKVHPEVSRQERKRQEHDRRVRQLL